MKKLIGVICAAALTLSSFAVMAEDDDREYTSEGGYFAVNKYDATIYHAPDGSTYSYLLKENGDGVSLSCLSITGKELIFPSTVNNVPVTAAHSEASSDILEKVIIPEGVKRIGWFHNYKNLKSVSLPETAEHIQFSAFENDEALESINLPNGLTVIEEYTFKNCTALKSVEIPSTVLKIEDSAFSGCTSLKAIEIPSSVEKIGLGAFYGCTALKSIKLNEGLLVIGRSAFVDCGIQTLNLPSTLKKIEESAFLRNKPLTSLIVPQDVSVIGGAAFSHTSIESVNFEGEPEQMGEQVFTDTPLTKVNGLSRKSIIKFWKAFKKTPWQESMKDDNEPFLVDEDGRLVAYIGTPTDVVIPETVKTIGSNAFNNSITSVKISNTVTQIEDAAFYCCEKLTEITIPASVTKIGQLAFSNCYSLRNITFEYSDKALTLSNGSFQFAPVAKESVNTNNRRITNFYPAFSNTVFDPDGDAMIATTKPTAEPQKSEKPSFVTEATSKPTENLKATEKPTVLPKPAEEPQVISVMPGESITVSVGDKEITFPDAQPFIDDNNRTLIPIRAIAEALGCNVEWNGETQTATITHGDKVVLITIGNNILQVGSDLITMDTAAEIKDERTYIPVRFVGEALGMEVNWVE